jgi:hypothetical protein
MGVEVVLKLSSVDARQVLEALSIRKEQWEYTAAFLDGGVVREGCVVEECSDSEEARGIARSYADIIQSVEEQFGLANSYSR